MIATICPIMASSAYANITGNPFLDADCAAAAAAAATECLNKTIWKNGRAKVGFALWPICWIANTSCRVFSTDAGHTIRPPVYFLCSIYF